MDQRWRGLTTPAGRHRYERWIVLSALAVLIGLGAAFAIATRVSLLTTRGGSMAPLFKQGDLAITLRADDYKVGDIVAYRTEPNGYMVLHRIVKIQNGEYTFKGDNNDFLDPDRPVNSKLVGRLAYRISGAGGVTEWMTTRTRAMLVIVGAFLLVAGTGVAKRHRRRGRPGRDPNRGNAPARAPSVPPNIRDLAAALGAPAALFIVVAVLTAAAFSRPLVQPATKKLSYTQSVNYDYEATAPAGVTYPDGKVTTGMPVFTKLVSSVQLHLTYLLDAGLPHDAQGTYSLEAEVSGGGTWKQIISLQADTPFTGSSFTTDTTLVFAELRRLVEQVKAETGAGGDALQISIIPKVTVQGSVGPAVMSDTYDTPIKLVLTPLELTFDSPKNGPTITTSKVSKLRVPTTKPRSITFLSRTMPVERGRTFSLVGLLFSGLWLANSARKYRLDRHGRETEKIGHKYHASIVEIRNLPPTARAVDVADMTMLGRLAERGEHLILHHHESGLHTYLVDDTSTLYRYATRDEHVTPPAVSPLAEAQPSAAGSQPTPPPYEAPVTEEPLPEEPVAEPLGVEVVSADSMTTSAPIAGTPPPYEPTTIIEATEAGPVTPVATTDLTPDDTPVPAPNSNNPLAAFASIPWVEPELEPELEPGDTVPAASEPAAAVDQPQSLDDALRLGPVTDAEIGEFGVTDSPQTDEGTSAT